MRLQGSYNQAECNGAGASAGSSACQKLEKEIDQGIEDGQWTIAKIPVGDMDSPILGVNEILAEHYGSRDGMDVAVGDIISCYSSPSGYCQVSAETSFRDGGTQWKLVPVSKETAGNRANEEWREMGETLVNRGGGVPGVSSFVLGTYEAAAGETLLGHELSVGERIASGLGAGLDLVGIGWTLKQAGKPGAWAEVGAGKGVGSIPNANTKVSLAPEIKAPNAIKSVDVTNTWENYLGKNTTNINPRTGIIDADRIFSADGTRSIRFGNHEMSSLGTPKGHFHFETWKYDRVNDVFNITNTLQRIVP